MTTIKQLTLLALRFRHAERDRMHEVALRNLVNAMKEFTTFYIPEPKAAPYDDAVMKLETFWATAPLVVRDTRHALNERWHGVADPAWAALSPPSASGP